MLQTSGEANSATYLVFSALLLALSILPWCVLMGTTFPLMMAYMREGTDQRTETFSYLYLANVLGATSGIAMAALVLVEIFGFKDTLRLPPPATSRSRWLASSWAGAGALPSPE